MDNIQHAVITLDLQKSTERTMLTNAYIFFQIFFFSSCNSKYIFSFFTLCRHRHFIHVHSYRLFIKLIFNIINLFFTCTTTTKTYDILFPVSCLFINIGRIAFSISSCFFFLCLILFEFLFH